MTAGSWNSWDVESEKIEPIRRIESSPMRMVTMTPEGKIKYINLAEEDHEKDKHKNN